MSFATVLEHLISKDERYVRFRGMPDPTVPRPEKPPIRQTSPLVAKPHRLPCINEGAVLEWCNTCTGELRHVRDCDLHDRCTRGVISENIRTCATCRDYKPDYGVVGAPAGVKIRDGLTTNLSGYAFNASLIRWRGGLLLAHRDGWKGSNIHIAELDESLRVTGTRRIDGLFRHEANYGREDPRLFVHNDRLHLAYIGVHGRTPNDIWTYQCYARLRDDLTVETTYCPQIRASRHWEKNWGFFSHNGELHAVYTISPDHLIVRISDDGVASVAHETTRKLTWNGGQLRGGAPPVRVGDEYWHFMHDRIEVAGLRIYRTGLYTFDAAPPFAVRRYIPEPILVADPLTKPADQYAAVLFTCGAVRSEDGATWQLSSGIHDRWIEVHEFRHDELEGRLVKIGGS